MSVLLCHRWVAWELYFKIKFFLFCSVLLIVTPIDRICNCSMFCCALLCVHSSIPIILMVKRELVALCCLSSWCLFIVVWLFLAMPRGCLQFVIVLFRDHTHLLFSVSCRGPIRNCLGQYREFPWIQTTDVHQESTLITRLITWRWRSITWHWRHRNHVNTITSVIAAKQTVIIKVFFSIKYRYSDYILLKNT